MVVIHGVGFSKPTIEFGVIFDAADIDYLIKNFNTNQLYGEIRNAQKKSNNLFDTGGSKLKRYYQDYIQACQLAIDIQKSLNQKVITASTSKFVPNESVNSIKARYDIVNYIEQYIPLKKTGSHYFGLCPFHRDCRTSSLVVYPQSQSFHCFGCGKNGDIFTFICEFEQISFPEVVRRLSGNEANR